MGVSATTSDAEVKAESVPEEEEEVHDGNDDGGFDGGVISREVTIKEEPSGADVVRSVKQQPDEKIKVKKEIKREGIDEKAGPREERKRKQLEIRRTKHIRLQMNRELDVVCGFLSYVFSRDGVSFSSSFSFLVIYSNY